MGYSKDELRTMIDSNSLSPHLAKVYDLCKDWVKAHKDDILKAHREALRKG